MSETANTTRSTNNNMSADDHSHGLLANSPLALAMMVLVCGGAWFFFSMLQITSTEQAVFGLLQSGLQANAGSTVVQIQEFMNGSLDRNQTIATAIAWAVQIALTMISFSPDAALLSMHKKYNGSPTSSLTKVAASQTKWRRMLMVLLVGGDILTDFAYVAQGHTLVAFNGILPSIANVGVFLVGIVYPAAICFVTIFVGKYLFVFVDALVDRLRGLK